MALKFKINGRLLKKPRLAVVFPKKPQSTVAFLAKPLHGVAFLFGVVVLGMLTGQAKPVEQPPVFESWWRDLMPPHPVSQRGPWFEGWYYRLYDPDQKVSVVVIATSAYRDGRNVPGYLATLVQLPSERAPRTGEVYPQDHEVRSVPSWRPLPATRKETFQWKALGGAAQLSEARVQISHGGLDLEISVEERRPWPDLLGLGPSGVLGFLRGLPLYWHVDSTGGRTRYRLRDQRSGEAVSLQGRGFLHQEKNWGEVFPKAWMWLQGISDDGRASLALAGGVMDLRAFEVNSFLVGFKNDANAYLFSPPSDPSTRYEFSTDSCTGRFELEAINKDFRMTVKASAPTDSFSFVSIPTADGYRPQGGIESFRSRIEVNVYRNDAFSRERLDGFVFDNAALEFGADYMKRCH